VLPLLRAPRDRGRHAGLRELHPLPPSPTSARSRNASRLLDTSVWPRASGRPTGNKIAALAADWPARVESWLSPDRRSLILTRHAATKRSATSSITTSRSTGEPGGAHRVRQWVAVHAEVQALWWPQPLRTAAEVGAADLENAEAQVLDYLQGWRSIVPTYEAIFDFDMEDALRRIEARSPCWSC
jgi:hypothetical protein